MKIRLYWHTNESQFYTEGQVFGLRLKMRAFWKLGNVLLSHLYDIETELFNSAVD